MEISFDKKMVLYYRFFLNRVLLYVVGEVIMKKMLMLIMFFVFMLSVHIDVKALTCEYNKDSNGMVLRLSKGSDNYWQLDTGDSSYGSRFRFFFASDSKLSSSTMTNCPSVIYYGCDGRSATCTISENNNVSSNTIKGSLNLKNGSSNVGGGSTGNNKTPNYSLGIFGGVTGNETCPAIFGSASDPDSIFGFMSKYIFTPIRWLTPVILIVLTSLDFAKAIFVDEKDGMGKAKSNFGKRAVAALIIFLAPTIVSILLTLIDGANVSQCMNNTEIGNL